MGKKKRRDRHKRKMPFEDTGRDWNDEDASPGMPGIKDYHQKPGRDKEEFSTRGFWRVTKKLMSYPQNPPSTYHRRRSESTEGRMSFVATLQAPK